MDNAKDQPENPINRVVSQDRRVTRSTTRTLESQVLGSTLPQIYRYREAYRFFSNGVSEQVFQFILR